MQSILEGDRPYTYIGKFRAGELTAGRARMNGEKAMATRAKTRSKMGTGKGHCSPQKSAVASFFFRYQGVKRRRRTSDSDEV